MKNVLALVATLMISGMAAAQSTAIEGNWGTQMSQNGISFVMTFTINHDSVTLTNVCTLNGKSVTAHVTVPASYDDSTLTIMAPGQDEESSNGVNCNVSAQADSMNYSIQGNLLTFTHEGSDQSFVLTRK